MSGKVAFVDTLRNAYDHLPADKKEEFKENMKKTLEKFCSQDLEAKVDRWLEPPSIGVIDVTNANFTTMLQESITCYVLEFYYSTISICGITAERLCMDILLRCKLAINGKTLSSDELESFLAIPYSLMIELLYSWGIIDRDVRDRLHKIKDIRNRYVHPDVLPEPNQLKKDSLEILTLLKYVLSQSFTRNPSMPPVQREL